MIKFFRKIRQQLLTENKINKYILYAIGEIVLVVIGILIALSINNWNETKKLRNRETKLLSELTLNLDTNIINLEKDIKTQKRGLWCINYIIDHVDHKRPFNDSLPNYLQIANQAPDVVLTSSAFETLKSSGIELIESDSLRKEITHLYEVVYPTLMQETRRLEDQVWSTAVVPLYQKHFRNDIKSNIWIPNDYETWLKDKEFINMLSFRGRLRIQSTDRKEKVAKQTIAVQKLIKEVLNKRNPD